MQSPRLLGRFALGTCEQGDAVRRAERALASGSLIGAGRGALWALLVGVGRVLAGLYAQTLRRMLTRSEHGQ